SGGKSSPDKSSPDKSSPDESSAGKTSDSSKRAAKALPVAKPLDAPSGSGKGSGSGKKSGSGANLVIHVNGASKPAGNTSQSGAMPVVSQSGAMPAVSQSGAMPVLQAPTITTSSGSHPTVGGGSTLGVTTLGKTSPAIPLAVMIGGGVAAAALLIVAIVVGILWASGSGAGGADRRETRPNPRANDTSLLPIGDAARPVPIAFDERHRRSVRPSPAPLAHALTAQKTGPDAFSSLEITPPGRYVQGTEST
ncbi:MAG: hypothetical protein WD872_05690, partial [Pirellulaceae bacterium]